MKDNKQKTLHSLFYKNNFKIMRFMGKQNKITFYPSLLNRNVLYLTSKYQKVTYLQGEV